MTESQITGQLCTLTFRGGQARMTVLQDATSRVLEGPCPRAIEDALTDRMYAAMSLNEALASDYRQVTAAYLADNVVRVSFTARNLQSDGSFERPSKGKVF